MHGQSRPVRAGAVPTWRAALGATLLGALLTGCGAPAPQRAPAPPTATPPALTLPADDPSALVTAERNAAAARDGARLAVLWAEDGRVIEARGAAGPADDYMWNGRAALLDRYAVAVFSSPPPPLDAPLVLEPQIEGESATLVNGADTWRFVRRDGRWWLLELVIDME